MENATVDARVRVAGSGPDLDGIVFSVPSKTKVVVAVVDSARGPGFRTVNPEALTERDEDGPSDAALRQLIRRTPRPGRGTGGGTGGGGHPRSSHARGAAHRPTGR